MALAICFCGFLAIWCTEVFLFLKLKLAHWQQLPHLWCGLAHWDAAVARRCAAEALDLFNRHDDAHSHHPISVRFAVTLRSDLDHFIAGAELLSLSLAFQEGVAEFLFIPVVERSIEQKHALVKMALHSCGLKGSTVRVSFASRLPELHQFLLHCPHQMPCLLDCFEAARHHRRVPSQLGLAEHPLVAALPPTTHSSYYTKVLRAIMYRVDVDSQSWSLAQEHSAHVQMSSSQKSSAPIAEHGVPLGKITQPQQTNLTRVMSVVMPFLSFNQPPSMFADEKSLVPLQVRCLLLFLDLMVPVVWPCLTISVESLISHVCIRPPVSLLKWLCWTQRLQPLQV